MTLRVNRLEKADGSQGVDTPYLIEGSAKAWANLNGTGTVTLRDSFNISSVVDNGTGDYKFNFTSVFTSNGHSSKGSIGGTIGSPRELTISGFTSNSFLQVFSIHTTGVADSEIVSVDSLGDLA